MPDFELTPEGHALVHPSKPLRWIRQPSGLYQLHSFSVVPPTPEEKLQHDTQQEMEDNHPLFKWGPGNKIIGRWHQTAHPYLHPNPKSDPSAFRHIPVEDSITHQDDGAPHMEHGGIAREHHLSHWTPTHDKIASESVRGALANENYKTKNFLIKYNKILKGE